MNVEWASVEPKTEIIVSGVRGIYWFRSYRSECDSVTVWGGDKNPNGHRSFQSFPSTRCRPIVRRAQHRERVQ
jgi:hypothetical protein